MFRGITKAPTKNFRLNEYKGCLDKKLTEQRENRKKVTLQNNHQPLYVRSNK